MSIGPSFTAARIPVVPDLSYLSIMKPLLCALALLPVMAHAQDYAQPLPQSPPKANTMEWNLGLGLGIDYGGVGAQVQCRPAPPLVIFAGGGYAFAGFGYNVGVQGRLLPERKWCPFVSGMYGYNAVIVVVDAEQYNEVYYGPSFGIGVENHLRDRRENFWRFELLLPLRPQEFQDDLDALKLDPAVEIRSEPPAFGISVAFHFGL